MQECNRCKAAGFPNQPIGFEKIGEDPVTGKAKWKLIDENGAEHVHKGVQPQKGAATAAANAEIAASNKEVAAALRDQAAAMREVAKEIREAFGRQRPA